jgi:predicted phage terminase large subunit-like protein
MKSSILEQLAQTAFLAEVERGVYRNNLSEYMKAAWPVIEPAPYFRNWHIDLIAEHLEAVTHGEIKRLLINLPPRYMKSTCVSILWPTWVWTRSPIEGHPHEPALEGPGTRWMFASYADDLAAQLSSQRRHVIESPWYQERWPESGQLTSDQNEKRFFSNSFSGLMRATTMGGSVTGLGGNYLVIDDPHKLGDGGSGKEIETQRSQYRHTFSSRHDNKKLGATVIVMQRISDKDLSAHVLENDEGYLHLKLEAEATANKIITFPRSGRIQTRNAGDLLWPAREGPAEIEKQKKSMGKWAYAAQYQQDPIPEGGSIFQRTWFDHRFVAERDGTPFGKKVRMIVQSWDTAAKKKESNDYWACTTWAMVTGGDERIYLLDHFKARMEYTEGRQKTKDLNSRWRPHAVLIEDSSSGTAIISDLRTTGIPLLAIAPAGSDKESNARAVSPMFEAGMIFLPSGAPWADEYIESMLRFPKGAHDDDVDSTSQALNYLRGRRHGVNEFIAREMEKEAERKLCWNPKCTNGEEGKRKKLEFNVPIYQVGAGRYCSHACANGNAAQGKPVPIWTGGTGGTSQFH